MGESELSERVERLELAVDRHHVAQLTDPPFARRRHHDLSQHLQSLVLRGRQPCGRLLGQVELEGEGARGGGADEGEGVKLLPLEPPPRRLRLRRLRPLRRALAAAVGAARPLLLCSVVVVVGQRVEIERLVRDEDEVGVKVHGLRRRLRRGLELDDAERIRRLDGHQLQVVLDAAVLVQRAQRLCTALLEQQRLEDVEVLVHRREAHRHVLKRVHHLAFQHGVQVPREDLL